MTKKDLIKKILELGKELEKADGFDAIMIVNDMEIEVDNYIKQLPIQNVVQQSEQLKAFLSVIIEEFDSGGVSWETRDSAESLLKSL
jgi:hypothetical protein